MKTLLIRKSIFSAIFNTLCVNSESYLSARLWPWVQHFISLTKRNLSQLFLQTKKRLALVLQDTLAILNALSKSASNSRTYSGLSIMLVAAPLASVCYQFFPLHPIDKTWYYLNMYYFLLTLAPDLSFLLYVTGLFLIFSTSKRAYFLIIPAGYHIAKIIWLVTVSSNEDFYRIVPFSFFVLGGLLASVWLFTFDFLMKLHFHTITRSLNAQDGITQLNIDYHNGERNGIDDDLAMAAIRKEYLNRKAIREI